jgi:hypothetical protein
MPTTSPRPKAAFSMRLVEGYIPPTRPCPSGLVPDASPRLGRYQLVPVLLDNSDVVSLSAPTIDAGITGRIAGISGAIDEQTAKRLAADLSPSSVRESP